MKFIGRDPLIKPVSADELSDIDLSGLASGDLLEFDGSNFVALTPGSGSGLDADLLDGNEASAFATSSQGSLADSAVQPGDDADTLGSGDAAAGTFLGSNGDGTADWQNLPNVESLDNGGATAGFVLQADGDGSSSFVDPDTLSIDAGTLDGNAASAFAAVAGDTFTGEVIFDNQIRTQPGTSLGTSGTLAINFASAALLSTGTLSGNVTFTTSNLAAGRTVTIRVINGGTDRTLTFPAGWKFVGLKPDDIAASKTGVLTATAFGTSDSDVVAAWAVEE